MVRYALVLFLFLPTILAAQTEPAMPRDAKIEALAADLHALARIVDVSKDLRDSRQILLAIIDDDIEKLREKRDDGTFRWASLQREEGGRVTDEKPIQKVQTEKELNFITVSAPNTYRVLVNVPRKRSLVSANNRVFVRNVIVDSTGFDGKTTHHEIPVNVWVNPGDSYGVPLPEIGKSVKAIVELGVESGNKQAVANVALLQAKLVDNPASPYFPAVTRLLQIRQYVKTSDIPRGALKTSLDEALMALPGELEKRGAELAQAEQARKQMMTTGMTTGQILAGDATPDVVKELGEIQRLLSGTLEQQAEARKRLQALSDALSPNQVPQTPVR